LHTAFALQSSHPALIRTLIADHLRGSKIDIAADIEEIYPPREPDKVTNVQGLQASLFSVLSVELFIQTLPPDVLWCHADDDTQFALAIRLAAREVRKISGCPDPDRNCATFSFGARFVSSLKEWQAAGDGRHASSVLVACARIVARAESDDIIRFYKRASGKGKIEYITRVIDRAEAWRMHLSKRHEAMRLMFWRKTDGSIEFANVGSKAGLEIF
jgi:hypothetical protein